jgi:hypothetical protein
LDSEESVKSGGWGVKRREREDWIVQESVGVERVRCREGVREWREEG